MGLPFETAKMGSKNEDGEEKMTACAKCAKDATAKYIDRSYCNSCFTAQVERVVRKQIRDLNIKQDARILVLDRVSRYFLERIVTMPIQLISKSKTFFGIKGIDEKLFSNSALQEFIKKEKIDAVLLPRTIDHENEAFLGSMFQDKRRVKPGKKFKMLFIQLSGDDLENFCRIRNIPHPRRKKHELGVMLDKLEERHPGIKRGLLKSSVQIREILGKK